MPREKCVWVKDTHYIIFTHLPSVSMLAGKTRTLLEGSLHDNDEKKAAIVTLPLFCRLSYVRSVVRRELMVGGAQKIIAFTAHAHEVQYAGVHCLHALPAPVLITYVYSHAWLAH